jgi:excisionase family DNA binding protein
MPSLADLGFGPEIKPGDLARLIGQNYITVQQLAKLQGVQYQTARRWVADGKVLAILVGGSYRIYESELIRFLQEGNRTPSKG